MKHPSQISIQDFTYALPQEKIANFPLTERDDSKLLVYKNNSITETKFNQVLDYLPKNSVLVFNDSKVITARLNFLNSNQQHIEIFCLTPPAGYEPSSAMQAKGSVNWLCLVGNLKKWKEDELCAVKNGVQLKVKIIAKRETDFELRFEWSNNKLAFYEILELFGHLPIPPYLKRESDEVDRIRYQTVYAQHKGSVAAPTAGLHFTDKILSGLIEKGFEKINLTLHVGAGTFKPVKSETMMQHVMHAEWLNIDLESIVRLKGNLNKTIVCVGTTSLRALESLYWMGLKLHHNPTIQLKDLEIKQWDVYENDLEDVSVNESLDALIRWMRSNDLERLNCETQILIAPPYQFKIAKGIITNFHQPQSTLLLLVAAIVGSDWKKIYDYALSHDFRFLSYGDSSLLLK